MEYDTTSVSTHKGYYQFRPESKAKFTHKKEKRSLTFKTIHLLQVVALKTLRTLNFPEDGVGVLGNQ